MYSYIWNSLYELTTKGYNIEFQYVIFVWFTFLQYLLFTQSLLYLHFHLLNTFLGNFFIESIIYLLSPIYLLLMIFLFCNPLSD